METQQQMKRNCAVVGGVLACTRFNNKTWQEYQTWLNANQETYEQIYHRPLKCIYGSPREISPKKIPLHAKILVIEMNNDENKIEGIGEIINQTASETYRRTQAVVSLATANSTPASGSVLNPDNNHVVNSTPSQGGGTPSGTPVMKFKIFSDRNYTRYIYIGNTRYASREELERNNTEDAQYINKQLEGLLPQQQQTSPIPLLELLLFKGARHLKRGSGITRCPFATTMLYASASSSSSSP
jgi:hypothetical protein